MIHDNLLTAIGNTPLIRLNGPSDATGCNILGKAEFLNPGGSVKDRAAKAIIQAAENNGQLQPNGIIVEGTAGNTGIGLTMVANVLGYRTVIVIPETQSQEKKDALRILGADLREVPAKPYSDPNNFVHVSRRIVEEMTAAGHNAIWANQFDNLANKDGHYQTTGPEIWQQTNGNIDGFICAVGTGGTLAGVAMALREKKSNIKIALADPEGAALYHYYAHGELKSNGSSISEGIGQARITANLQSLNLDYSYQIPDSEGLPVIFDLLKQEGLCLGSSSAINIAGAMRFARDIGPNKTIVTILCDSGTRYLSKLFNSTFLKEKNLPVPDWL